jgi:hypothetical protein
VYHHTLLVIFTFFSPHPDFPSLGCFGKLSFKDNMQAESVEITQHTPVQIEHTHAPSTKIKREKCALSGAACL